MSSSPLSRVPQRLRALTALATICLALALVGCISTDVEDRPDAVGKPGSGGGTAPVVDEAFEAFRTEFWTPMRSETCTGCHGAGQTPQFAHADAATAYQAAQGFIDLNTPGASRIVTYPASGHNPCPPDAAGCAAKIQGWIEDMQLAIDN